MRTGLRRLVKGKIELYALPHAVPPIMRGACSAIAMAACGWEHPKDSCMCQGTTDVFTEADGLSGNSVNGMLEDREGNIWVYTPNGFDRFHDVAVPTFTPRQGLSTSAISTALAGSDGSVCIGSQRRLEPMEGRALHDLAQGPATAGHRNGIAVRGQSWADLAPFDARARLPREWPVRSSGRCSGRAASRARHRRRRPGHDLDCEPTGRLLRVRGTEMRNFTWAELGHRTMRRRSLADRGHGGLWLGFFNGGVAYFLDGHSAHRIRAPTDWEKGTSKDTEARSRRGAMGGDRDGLSRLKNGRIATLTSRNGLPCDSVHWAIDGRRRSYWLGTACGSSASAVELDGWSSRPDRGQDVKRPIRVACSTPRAAPAVTVPAVHTARCNVP